MAGARRAVPAVTLDGVAVGRALRIIAGAVQVRDEGQVQVLASILDRLDPDTDVVAVAAPDTTEPEGGDA